LPHVTGQAFLDLFRSAGSASAYAFTRGRISRPCPNLRPARRLDRIRHRAQDDSRRAPGPHLFLDGGDTWQNSYRRSVSKARDSRWTAWRLLKPDAMTGHGVHAGAERVQGNHQVLGFPFLARTPATPNERSRIRTDGDVRACGVKVAVIARPSPYTPDRVRALDDPGLSFRFANEERSPRSISSAVTQAYREGLADHRDP